MKRRIYWSTLISCFLVLVISLGLTIDVMYRTYWDELKGQTAQEAHVLSAFFDGDSMPGVDAKLMNGENRVTLIDEDGTVLIDTRTNAEQMGNHSDRPEVQQALATGLGEEIRESATMGQQTYYYAVRLSNGKVLRVSNTTSSALGILKDALPMVLLIAFLMILLSFLVAEWLSITITKPINAIDLENPTETDTYEELAPLLGRMRKMHERIDVQMSELTARQREFANVTEQMQEGLVLFGLQGKILLANRSAKILFGWQAGTESYLSLCREQSFIKSVRQALEGKPAIGEMEREGRIYELTASPVEGGGAVLFAVDVTEREQAQQMRREFSANVSHELKTPLTSIMGYAEIMQNGIARAEDTPAFAGKIHAEAARLLALIEDIIALSKLDEKEMQDQFETVNLNTLCETVVSELRQKAEKRGITVEVEANNEIICGVPRILHEMIFNLCDNALTYGKEQGHVWVTLKSRADDVTLTVKDDGIGIAKEQQSRVFERFYRVDKSRSKETGGTGLGLSIVKHGAKLHDAQISMASELGQGTEIALTFAAKR